MVFSYILSKRPANLFCGSYFFSYLCAMSDLNLYQQIENAIIKWSNDGTQTAGTLTRQILEIIHDNKVEHHDVDFMYKWINKHSRRNEQNQ